MGLLSSVTSIGGSLWNTVTGGASSTYNYVAPRVTSVISPAVQTVQRATQPVVTTVQRQVVQPVQQRVIQPVQQVIRPAQQVVQQRVIQPVQTRVIQPSTQIVSSGLNLAPKVITLAPQVIQTKITSGLNLTPKIINTLSPVKTTILSAASISNPVTFGMNLAPKVISPLSTAIRPTSTKITTAFFTPMPQAQLAAGKPLKLDVFGGVKSFGSTTISGISNVAQDILGIRTGKINAGYTQLQGRADALNVTGQQISAKFSTDATEAGWLQSNITKLNTFGAGIKRNATSLNERISDFNALPAVGSQSELDARIAKANSFQADADLIGLQAGQYDAEANRLNVWNQTMQGKYAENQALAAAYQNETDSFNATAKQLAADKKQVESTGVGGVFGWWDRNINKPISDKLYSGVTKELNYLYTVRNTPDIDLFKPIKVQERFTESNVREAFGNPQVMAATIYGSKQGDVPWYFKAHGAAKYTMEKPGTVLAGAATAIGTEVALGAIGMGYGAFAATSTAARLATQFPRIAQGVRIGATIARPTFYTTTASIYAGTELSNIYKQPKGERGYAISESLAKTGLFTEGGLIGGFAMAAAPAAATRVVGTGRVAVWRAQDAFQGISPELARGWRSSTGRILSGAERGIEATGLYRFPYERTPRVSTTSGRIYDWAKVYRGGIRPSSVAGRVPDLGTRSISRVLLGDGSPRIPTGTPGAGGALVPISRSFGSSGLPNVNTLFGGISGGGLGQPVPVYEYNQVTGTHRTAGIGFNTGLESNENWVFQRVSRPVASIEPNYEMWEGIRPNYHLTERAGVIPDQYYRTTISTEPERLEWFRTRSGARLPGAQHREFAFLYDEGVVLPDFPNINTLGFRGGRGGSRPAKQTFGEPAFAPTIGGTSQGGPRNVGTNFGGLIAEMSGQPPRWITPGFESEIQTLDLTGVDVESASMGNAIANIASGRAFQQISRGNINTGSTGAATIVRQAPEIETIDLTKIEPSVISLPMDISRGAELRISGLPPDTYSLPDGNIYSLLTGKRVSTKQQQQVRLGDLVRRDAQSRWSWTGNYLGSPSRSSTAEIRDPTLINLQQPRLDITDITLQQPRLDQPEIRDPTLINLQQPRLDITDITLQQPRLDQPQINLQQPRLDITDITLHQPRLDIIQQQINIQQPRLDITNIQIEQPYIDIPPYVPPEIIYVPPVIPPFSFPPMGPGGGGGGGGYGGRSGYEFTETMPLGDFLSDVFGGAGMDFGGLGSGRFSGFGSGKVRMKKPRKVKAPGRKKKSKSK